MMSDLYVVSSGMCCGVGYSTKAATAAIRAGLDHFRETDFIDDYSEPLIGSQLYQGEMWGEARLQVMMTQVIRECLSDCVEAAMSRICLLLLLPEQERKEKKDEWFAPFLQAFHPSSQQYYLDEMDIGGLLQYARALLTEHTVQYVLLVGVDSHFSPSRINHYLNGNRLLSSNNSDGFIPGEGAGAILFTGDDGHEGVYISGIGVAYEPANILQEDKPCRGDGLAFAINQAVNNKGSLLSQTDFHMSNVNGESWYFRESSLAIARCLDHKKESYPHYQISKNVGAVGAASGPLMLAYLQSVMPHPYGPGLNGLIHLSTDSGLRSALWIEYRTGQKGEI